MLSPVKSIKIYEMIMEQIKDIVKNGKLKSGDKLPSERELCEKLEVSRASVREALRALQMLGLTELKEIMDELNDNFDIEICASLDKRFHYKIAQASGNNLISTVMFSISSLIEKYIENSKIHTLNRTLVKLHHEEIWRALEVHDGAAASDAVKKHLELSYNV